MTDTNAIGVQTAAASARALACSAAIEVVHEISWRVDHGQADQIVELFTEDVTLEGPGPKVRCRADMQAAMAHRVAQRQITSRHVHSNFRVGEFTGDTLVLHHVVTLYRSETEAKPAQAMAVLDVTDRLRCDAQGRWRIAVRQQVPVFASV